MNELTARVSDIQSVQQLNLVTFTRKTQELSMISLSLNLPLDIGSSVTLGFKAHALTLAKNLHGELSCQNALPCIIKELQFGKLLTNVILESDGELIESVITTKAAHDMKLQEKENITALIKANDISVIKVNV